MATITCVETTTALAHRLGAVSPPVRTTDHLTFVVEYAEAFHLAVAMNALYQPLREALAQLPGWASATATRTGWQHLTAYLDWAGNPAWTAALQGQTERFAISQVSVDATQGPAPYVLPPPTPRTGDVGRTSSTRRLPSHERVVDAVMRTARGDQRSRS